MLSSSLRRLSSFTVQESPKCKVLGFRRSDRALGPIVSPHRHLSRTEGKSLSGPDPSTLRVPTLQSSGPKNGPDAVTGRRHGVGHRTNLGPSPHSLVRPDRLEPKTLHFGPYTLGPPATVKVDSRRGGDERENTVLFYLP